jgi:hypothetical protein
VWTLLLGAALADEAEDYARQMKEAPPVVVEAPPPPMQAPAEWEYGYQRGMKKARVGLLFGPIGAGTGVVGGVAMIYGFGTGRPGPALAGIFLLAGGATLVIAGPPVSAAGSIRAARALQHGGSDVKTDLGMATWGLWGGSMLSSSVASALPNGQVVSSLGGVAFVGSYGTAWGQMRVDARAHSRLVASPHPGELPLPGDPVGPPPADPPDTTHAPAPYGAADLPAPTIVVGFSPLVLPGGGGFAMSGRF